jgi:hypothetical protein
VLVAPRRASGGSRRRPRRGTAAARGPDIGFVLYLAASGVPLAA